MADPHRTGPAPRYRIEAGTADRTAADAAAETLRALGLDASVRHAGSLPVADDAPDDAIVAVGMGLAVPGASSPDAFWELLRDRVPQFSEPGDRMDIDALWSADPAAPDKTYTRTSGFLHDFAPHPRLREELDGGTWRGGELSGRWLRHSVLQALDGVRSDGLRSFAAVGMTADGGHAAEHSLLRHGGRLLTGTGDPLAGLYPDGGAGTAATAPYRVVREALAGLPEPVETVVVDTACSSSLYSFDFGMRALREGRADIALCGGAYTVNAQTMVLFAKLDGLARHDRVRSLDRTADGVLFADGAAVVALKTYARARADGDPVLGFVRGFGGSSDGRGKAVYAPNPAGQRIALERAWAAAGVRADEIDWVVAHATGTAAGDQAEVAALTEAAPGKRWTLTSNKSLIGHTGWAAGAVNVIHALLALRHEAIPAQHLYTGPLTDTVTVPGRTRPWRPSASGRIAAVSAMGFGGTNAHLVLGDRPGGSRSPADPEPVVLVAATGLEPTAGPVFGDTFPAPAPLEVRLPPAVLARLDRSQLMALRCALDLRDALGGDKDGLWTRGGEVAARTGVFVGHSGPVWQALACTLRVYADDIAARGGPAALTTAVRALSPEANSDSLPGLMPNIIASRVAQLLDVHGPNMTLDAGPDSSHAALAAACRDVARGRLDAAVVIGMNPTADMVRAPDGGEVGEAVAGVVLMRRAVAEARGLAVLGSLAPAGEADAAEGAPGRSRQPAQAAAAGLRRGPLSPPAGDSGPAAPPAEERPGRRYFHAAEGLMALHRAVVAGDGETVLAPGEPGTPALVYEAAEPDLGDLRPHVLRLRRLDQPRIRTPLPALGPETLVVTNAPERLAATGLPDGCLVAVPQSLDAGGLTDPDDLAGRPVRHVRVLYEAPRDGSVPPATLELHDLAFAAAQAYADAIEDGGSFALLALDGAATPGTGLFTGLVRALTADLPGGLVYGVVTDGDDLAAALELLGRESALDRHLAVAHYRHGARHEAVLTPDDERPERRALPRDPVIVATGGGRGITAELVDQLARESRPAAIWLLGSGPEAPAGVPGDLPAGRPAALRRLMAEHPGEKIAALNRRYDQARLTAERRRTIDRLAARHGTVHYRRCDVTDAAAVRRTAAEIARAGGADIIVHGAGIERATALRRKPLAEFRAVRDVKVRGLLNLRAAFAAQDPALWLSISSVTTVVPRAGEADYISANTFLTRDAARTRATADAHALVSGLWTESGMVTHTQVADAYLAREDNFTHLDDDLGRRYFRTEIRHRRDDDLTSVWLGGTEWRMLGATAPGLRSAGLRHVPAGAFIGGEPVRRADGAAVWEVAVGLDGHPYLLDHLVDGRPTLPGTFIVELAAEAAAAAGGGRPVAVTDAVFSRFIRAGREQWPRRLVVSARGAGERIEVVVSSPPRGPVPAQEHSRMTVHLARSYGTARPSLPEATGTALDPYALPGSPVELTGVFDSLREQRVSGGGASARLHLPPPGGLEPLRDFLLPALALDSLLRATAAAAPGADGPAVPVPVRIDRIDLYTAADDVHLAEEPALISLRHRQGPPSRSEAVDEAGRVLFAVTGLTTRDKRAAPRLSEAGRGTR